MDGHDFRLTSSSLFSLVEISLLAASLLPTATEAAPPLPPKIIDLEITGDVTTGDLGIIWSDNFDDTIDLDDDYHDVNNDGGRFGLVANGLSGAGKAVRQQYQPGQVNAGWLWRFFADNPLLSAPGSRVTEVYVRWYHRFDEPFQGVPPKLARLGGFALADWTLSFMVHHWTNPSTELVIADVASNIEPQGTTPVHSGYNGFVRWLPVANSNFDFGDSFNKGRWICHEMRVKLNTPFQSNGIYQYWADGQPIIDMQGRNLVGGYVTRGINGMQWDCYWNQGSPAAQSRTYDNVVIATRPIGPAQSSMNPQLTKSRFSDPDPGDAQSAWQVQVANNTTDLVWDSGTIFGAGDQVRVTQSTGTFMGSCAGRTSLRPSTRYWLRTRQRDTQLAWSSWSRWHAVLQTGPQVIAFEETGAPVQPLVLSIHPNPSPGPTTFTLFGDFAGAPELGAQIAIYNVNGALVRNLGLASDGDVLWDGRDERGRRLANGLYFCKAISGRSHSIARLTLVR